MKVCVPVIVMLALLSVATGCKKFGQVPSLAGRSAAQLVQEAETLLKAKKWERGRSLLRVVENELPSSAEFPKAKLLLADSYFFQSATTYPEALVEFQSFLNYFPTHEKRDYALYRMGLCHYAAIESAERDQSETRLAITAFQRLIAETPGSPYVVDAKAKVTQCWFRIAESELIVGIQYVNSYHFEGAETRLKGLMETYPEYADRERTYFYLGEAMRRKLPSPSTLEQFSDAWLAKIGKSDWSQVTREESAAYNAAYRDFYLGEIAKYRSEAQTYYLRLQESYPKSLWASRAKDRLLEMGQGSKVKESYDS